MTGGRGACEEGVRRVTTSIGDGGGNMRDSEGGTGSGELIECF